MSIAEQELRNAMYDILFECQPGTHGTKKPESADEMMYKLAKKLRIRPVSLKPFYTVHWEGDEQIAYPHIKSHLTGRRYEIKEEKAVRIDGVNWSYEKSDDRLVEDVASYERNRGIGITA